MLTYNESRDRPPLIPRIESRSAERSGADDDERGGDRIEGSPSIDGRGQRRGRWQPGSQPGEPGMTARTRSSLTGVSGATTSDAPNAQRAGQPEQRPTVDRRPKSPRCTPTARPSRHRRGPFEVVDGERSVGERERREQRVVGAERAVAGEVDEVGCRPASASALEPSTRRGRDHGRSWSARARRPRASAKRSRVRRRTPPAATGPARRRAIAQPVSDGLTDTGRPQRPESRPTGRRAARRSAR